MFSRHRHADASGVPAEIVTVGRTLVHIRRFGQEGTLPFRKDTQRLEDKTGGSMWSETPEDTRRRLAAAEYRAVLARHGIRLDGDDWPLERLQALAGVASACEHS